MSDLVAVILYVAILAACTLGSFMVLTRRGPWRRRPDAPDWTTTKDCARCNEHGPYPAWDSAILIPREQARDIHQAWHTLVADLLAPVVRASDRLDAACRGLTDTRR